MDPAAESAFISAAATIFSVGATATVAIVGFRISRSATDKTVAAARDTNQATIDAAHADVRRSLDATRDGQIADRYTKAIEQLGSSTVDVTIGGIYALERIAHDSPEDHPTVMEVLAACIREHSDEPLPGRAPVADATQRVTRPDIQAAVTVIGRRDTTRDRRPINLRRVNLSHADLPQADLSGADLTDADLTRADLKGITLKGAKLMGAHLEDANLAPAEPPDPDIEGVYTSIASNLHLADLTHAHLTGADLTGANITDARLSNATLRQAILVAADFGGADLDGAELSGANLYGADLYGAKLTGVNLVGAAITDARLVHANLADANLTDANLTHANLTDATATDINLARADLTRANLTNANLAGAILAEADLSYAIFTSANLFGANITEANLTATDLTGTLWPSDAAVPEGWQRDVGSSRLKRGNGATAS
jgi:uncharacterized protein YjbI with pentapeptide repeats